ncbi:MAG: protein kinase [Proteobacteria bacterium]|nr:protein kinase [Pseudomonadota bacterium]
MAGPRDTLAGRVLDGRYRLDARIGRGGMGSVYRGRHLMMDRDVAIKVLRPDVAEDPTAVRRFAREAKSTFRFDHPNCVRVTDFGVADQELLFLVMEYLDGRTLHDEVDIDGPIAGHRAVHIARQICEALECAHQLGFIHRDLKPENIMLVSRGGDRDFVKVLDFGLAKLMSGPAGMYTNAISVSPLTAKGTVFGTPEYMSPEQASDAELTPATDIYSLGVVLYQMLTGEVPFSGDNFMRVLARHIQEPPISPADCRPDLAISAELSTLVVQCMAKQPDARPVSARVLAQRLAGLETALTAQFRPSSGVAAQSTIDLNSADVRVAASQLGAFGKNRPGRERRSADFGHMERPAGVRRSALPNNRSGSPDTRSSRRRPIGILLTLAGAGAALLVGILVLFPDPDRSPAQTGPDTASASAVDRPSGLVHPGRPDVVEPASPAARPDDESPSQSLAESLHNAATGRAGPGSVSDPASRGTRDRVRPGQAAKRAARRRRALRHIRAAQQARKAESLSKQIAEAEEAVRIDPANPTANYLFGDALVRSGSRYQDPESLARGCEHLRRARALARARSAYRLARCGSSD